MEKITIDLLRSYDGDSDKGYILEVDVEYPKNLYNFTIFTRENEN